MTKTVNEEVLEFLQSFLAGGVNQDFRPWASDLYRKLYRAADEPSPPHILERLAESGNIERKDDCWIYGEGVSVDYDSDPKGKAIRERFSEVAEDIRRAGYVIDDRNSDSDHDSFWITFAASSENRPAEPT